MAGALAAARGGARDGHKLGECLAHFCAPCAPCRPLTQAAPSLAGFIPIFGAGSAAIPSFCPCWLQVVPPGDSWDISPHPLPLPDLLANSAPTA